MTSQVCDQYTISAKFKVQSMFLFGQNSVVSAVTLYIVIMLWMENRTTKALGETC